MKITKKDGWCIILLTALQLGYSVSFNEDSLQDYLTDKAAVPPPFIALLEKEANHFSRQICLDGKDKEGNQIAESIYQRNKS